MNTNYHLSDIIGTNYKNGPVRFMPNSFSILCSIGNRLKSIDLKRNLSHTSDIHLDYNICNFAINNSGTHAFIASENASCNFVNLNNDIVLHSFSTQHKVRALAFSPDSRFIAIATEGIIKIYAIGQLIAQSFNPLNLVNNFKHSTENVNSLDWSSDGRLVVAGGENRVVKVFAAEKLAFLNVGVFTFGQPAPTIGVWFIDDDYGLICVDKSGKASVWQSSLKANQLIQRSKKSQQIPSNESERLAFIRIRRENLCQNVDSSVQITASVINKSKKLLVSAYTNGVFCIFEFPEFRLMQNFRAGEERITSIDINSSGDWLAIGCGQGSGAQLMVWEWQSESYILRQQSHSQTITGAAYSPDGSLIATGAEDGKVKLWKCNTSLCLVTFTEHESGVTDICFTQSGKALLSASMEGSIRAHDLKRYRNFRTLVAPKQTQLNLLCADLSGDIVMASSRDQFEIYIWALETSQLLETLTGHSNIITGLATFDNTLCSVSRDKSLKFWNIMEGNCLETVHLLNECLDVKYSPTGTILAVLCFDSSINLYDTQNTQQIGSIETKLDIDIGRGRKEKIKKSTLEKNKTFTCLAFSPNSQFLLAGGQSNVFCLYSVADRIRVRTFKLSSNLSLDGTALDIDYRKVTEFGNLDLFDLSDSEEEERNPEKKIRLPGTKHSDLSERALKPIIMASKIAFSPTGQDFAVVSSEGVHIFTQARIRRFDPFQLELDITPDQVLRFSRNGQCTKALMFALRLNENDLIRKVIESMPMDQFPVVIGELEFDYAERLLAWIAESQSGPAPTKHFHFYLLLVKELLYTNGVDFKRSLEQNKPTLTAIQQILTTQQNLLMNMCDQNLHSLEYILMARKMSEL